MSERSLRKIHHTHNSNNNNNNRSSSRIRICNSSRRNSSRRNSKRPYRYSNNRFLRYITNSKRKMLNPNRRCCLYIINNRKYRRATVNPRRERRRKTIFHYPSGHRVSAMPKYSYISLFVTNKKKPSNNRLRGTQTTGYKEFSFIFHDIIFYTFISMWIKILIN